MNMCGTGRTQSYPANLNVFLPSQVPINTRVGCRMLTAKPSAGSAQRAAVTPGINLIPLL